MFFHNILSKITDATIIIIIKKYDYIYMKGKGKNIQIKFKKAGKVFQFFCFVLG